MQILSEKYKGDAVKLLYYLQRIGDLNPKILGAIAGIRNAQELIGFLKSNFVFNSFPYVHEYAFKLRKYFFTIYSKKWISLSSLYEFFDATIGYALRDLLHPEKVYLMIYFNNNMDFIRVFDYLLDNNLIYHYEYLGAAKENLVYPLDYSSFDFEKKEFKGIGNERLPFENPSLYDDFTPDYSDVVILGKKQEIAYMNLKEISDALHMSLKDVIYHYQKHIIGKGLISAYGIILTVFDYRLQVFFEKKETLNYLTKIPTLFLVYRLEDNDRKETYIANILGNVSQIMEYISFIKKAKYLFNDNVEVTIHPYNKEHFLIASIPYEHYTKEGRWDFNVERMLLKVEKLLT